MTVEPNGTRVYALIIQDEGISASGLITNVNGAVATETATIEAIGDECVKYKIGDKILLSKRCGTPIKLDGKEYIVLKEIDVLGKILQ